MSIPRRNPGALIQGLAAGIVLFWAPTLRAQGTDKPPPRTSSLSWIRLAGADACVSTRELARDVEERLGRTVFVSPAQADVSVEGHIEPTVKRSGWNATIIVRDAKGALLGTRELHRDDSSCKEMREPLALVIAVMIDPDAALGDSEKHREVSTPAPVIIVKEKPVIVRVPTSDQESRWRFDAGASMIGGLGLLPNPALGVYGGGLLEPLHFVPLQGFGAVWLDNTASAEGPGRATFSLVFLGGGICPLTWRAERLSAYACANGHVGLIKSRGEGFDQPRPDDQKFYLAGALEGRLSVRVLGPIAIRGAISAVVPLMRDTFVYRRSDGTSAELFRMAPVVAMGDLGFGVVLP